MNKSFAYGVLGLLLSACATPTQNQPHMENALASLQSAHADLTAASTTKGGHRVEALRLVDGAIAEVRAGIAYADRH